MSKPNFIFDTNTFLSAILLENSTSARALDKAFQTGKIVVSDATFLEFTQVLFRKKFDKYLTTERRLQALSKLERDTTLQSVTTRLNICRDPKDDKYLELAVDSNAACIISSQAIKIYWF